MMGVWTRNRERLNHSIDQAFISFGQKLYELFTDCGAACIFFWDSCRMIFKRPFRFEELMQHMEFVGNQSVLIICMTSIFTGLALSFQIYLGFVLVNATNLVGPTV